MCVCGGGGGQIERMTMKMLFPSVTLHCKMCSVSNCLISGRAVRGLGPAPLLLEPPPTLFLPLPLITVECVLDELRLHAFQLHFMSFWNFSFVIAFQSPMLLFGRMELLA